jgi:hypothetical protein
MTHAEMVEEVIKLHEWVKHWWQRAEDAEKFAAGLEANLAAVIQRAEAAESKLAETEDAEAKLGAIQAANVLHDAQLAATKSRLAHTQAGLTVWMERSKANARELDEAYDAMCEIAKTLDCAEDWPAIKGKLAEAQKEEKA